MNRQRRRVLQAGCAGLLLGAGVLLPGALSAAPPMAAQRGGGLALDAAFGGRSLAEVLDALGARAAQPTELLHIEAAQIAENGAEVPIAVRSELADTDLIVLLVANNPFKLAAVFEFAASTTPALQTRLKFNESSELIVLARAGGQFHLARRLVRVTLGGCLVGMGTSSAARPDAAQAMRIRARRVDEERTELRVLMPHVMETGLRTGLDGALLPAHYITEFSARHGQRQVLGARFGPSVAANPYLLFSFEGGRAGERVHLHWRDNRGHERSDAAAIS